MVLAGCVVLGVVLAGIGAFLSSSADADQSSSSPDRHQVIARANDFAVAYNTYDVNNLADYHQRLKGLLTPKYDAQFVEVTNAIFAALKDKKQVSGDAKVLATAVDNIDDDSADVIVAVDASISNTDNKAAVLRHFRWKLSFAKTKGDWLISNFESVASVEASAGDPAATPGTDEGGSK